MHRLKSILSCFGFFLISCNSNNPTDQASTNQQSTTNTASQTLVPNTTQKFSSSEDIKETLSYYFYAIVKTEKIATVKSEMVLPSGEVMPVTGQGLVPVLIVSDIAHLNDLSEDTRARYEDAVRESLQRFSHNSEKVFSIELKWFSTYAEASSSRKKIEYDHILNVILPMELQYKK